MTEPAYQQVGMAEVLDVAENGTEPRTGEADGKMLALLLGTTTADECTAHISEPEISVWYSWLQRPLPSKYVFCLAPGLVWRLMQLGGVQRIIGDAVFQVGPGTTGTGRYISEFPQKWIRITSDKDCLMIRVRDKRDDLNDQTPEFFLEDVLCKQCNGILRTPLAKQCLHCGHDWH